MTDEELAAIETCIGRCQLCGGFVGPDPTMRPMCYRCAPRETTPSAGWAVALVAEVRRLRASILEVEWKSEGGTCPWCGGSGRDGVHADWCIALPTQPDAPKSAARRAFSRARWVV